mgnify:CR=1 FL=1
MLSTRDALTRLELDAHHGEACLADEARWCLCGLDEAREVLRAALASDEKREAAVRACVEALARLASQGGCWCYRGAQYETGHAEKCANARLALTLAREAWLPGREER